LAATGPGANDGFLSLWIDGALAQTLTGVSPLASFGFAQDKLYDNANKLTAVNGVSQTWDANSNMTSRVEGA
jgi:hypothetical protein